MAYSIIRSLFLNIHDTHHRWYIVWDFGYYCIDLG